MKLEQVTGNAPEERLANLGLELPPVPQAVVSEPGRSHITPGLDRMAHMHQPGLHPALEPAGTLPQPRAEGGYGFFASCCLSQSHLA